MTAFDVREHRHRLKLLRDSGETALYENRGGAVCPACGEPFVRLFSTEREATTFPENDGARFCLLRGADGALVFRH